MLKTLLNRLLQPAGPESLSHPASPGPPEAPAAPVLHAEGTLHDHDFTGDARFMRAYQRGVKADGEDRREHWRVHVGLWSARLAAALDGDFVACGAGRSGLESAIMQALSWNTRGRRFYLLDDYGVPAGPDATAGIDVEQVRRNVAEWHRVSVLDGPVAETLAHLEADRVAFATLDLARMTAEPAAFEWLWERLVPGGVLLLGDYAAPGFEARGRALDAAAEARRTAILSLPTGQGLLIRPASPGSAPRPVSATAVPSA